MLTVVFSVTIPSLREYLLLLFASYTIIEFTFFFLFYIYLFPKKEKIRWITGIIWATFVAFAVFDFFYINTNRSFDSLIIGIESIILLLLCGYFLFYQVTHTLDTMVYRTFEFWVIITFFFYISGTFFLYIMTDTMGEDPNFRKYYFIINMTFNILKNCLLCIALVMKTNQQIRKTEARPEIDLGDELILQHNL